ncbi:MAG TPA: hypothetical protein VL122_00875 [Nitrospirota bacterium]|nr:hypothetical protein [Nitrospirota bacterium]
MSNLFLSFTIAIGCAIVLVAASRLFDFESYTNKILPLIPVLYAVIYETLDRQKGSRSAKTNASLSRGETKKVSTSPEAGITAGKVIADVAVSIAITLFLELFLAALFLRVSGQVFSDVYGAFDIETVAHFLRGEQPWLSGKDCVYLLALVALISTVVTGSWIGHTSKGNAILEGVFTGAVVTLINSMTNMMILYRTMEEATVKLAGSMGYVMHAGFLVVMGVQLLLYGLWSGLVQMRKQDRERKNKKRRN